MADVVQYRLERMANELDDLERRGLFTRCEIAEIVKQRRKFEYRLKCPLPLKQDYIAYIDYEFRLDDLWRLHKKAAAREVTGEGKKKIKMKTSISDYAAVTRIVEIYRLAVMRYKGDVELWFRYLEFCRQKRNGRMKKKEEQTKPLVCQVISQVAFHKILTAYKKAKSMGCLSEELACDYISFCEQIGRFIEAKKLAEKFCGGNLSRSVRLWLLRVSLKVRSATRNSLSISKDENQSIFELLKDILTILLIAETDSLWLLLGTSETAAAVYRRAPKVLKDSAVGFASTNQ